MTPTFIPGQHVRDIYGENHVVMLQRGPEVVMLDGTRWHPTKLRPILYG